jgi:flavin reductase (DIM6/NTAB) family NADH-FMN oxidoreductase RutF
MFYDARRKAPLRYDPVKALVAPRPIGWISTLSLDGVANLAPYSFFNLIASGPSIVAFSSAGRKDS